ncbi:MAG: hypothetical protein ABWY83_04060 [Actinomycetota bacterium]
MRLATRLLVPLTAVAFVACSGGDDSPPPVAQRFPTAADAPGSKDDPVEQGESAEDLEEFVVIFRPALIDPDDEEVTSVFQEAGFKRAGLDVRFFGETHLPTAPHLFSWFIELDSEDGAKNALDFLEADTMKPCPQSCASVISSFDVDGIPDARGVRRIATAEDIEAAGTEDEDPSESYWVGFTVGSIVYTLDLGGLPGSVSEEQAQGIVSAYYERLTGG